MRLIVRSKDMKLWIPIPTGLLFSNLSACIATKIMNRHGVAITKQQAIKLCRAVRKCKHRHRNLTLVEAQTAEGDYVKITL